MRDLVLQNVVFETDSKLLADALASQRLVLWLSSVEVCFSINRISRETFPIGRTTWFQYGLGTLKLLIWLYLRLMHNESSLAHPVFQA